MTTELQDLQKQVLLLQEQNAELVERIRVLSLQDREKLNLIKTLFDRAPFGMMMLDSNRLVVQMNVEAERILGVERHQQP